MLQIFFAQSSCTYVQPDSGWRIEIVGYSKHRSLCVVYRKDKFVASIQAEHSNALGDAVEFCISAQRRLDKTPGVSRGTDGSHEHRPG